MFPTAVAGIIPPVAFRAHATVAQSVAATTFTRVLFDRVTFDTSGSLQNSTFVAPSGGMYLFSAGVTADTLDDGQRMLIVFYLNGVRVVRLLDTAVGAITGGAMSGTAILKLQSDDRVETYGYYSVAETTAPGPDNVYFSGVKLG